MSNKHTSRQPYVFNVTEILEGQRFPSLTALFRAATGRDLPNGASRNFYLKKLGNYLTYAPAYLFDPDEKAKNAVIVVEIYPTPLRDEDNRGRKGKYADILGPLILAQGSFSGKICRLFNVLGLWEEYLELKLAKMDEWSREHIGYDIDLFPIKDVSQFGLRRYLIYLRDMMHSALKSRLESLEEQEKLTWSKYYMILPQILTPVDETTYIRQKAKCDIEVDGAARHETINYYASLENSVLDPEKLRVLDITGKYWDKEFVTLQEYKEKVKDNDTKLVPIRATERQAAAIENYNLFINQLAVKQYYKEDTLRPVSELPAEQKIKCDARLYSLREQLSKRYREEFLNCKSLWVEISFFVEPTVWKDVARNKPALAKELTKRFYQTIDKWMKTGTWRYQRKYAYDWKNDLTCKLGEAKYREDTSYSRLHNKSATEFHEELKMICNL